MAKSKVTICPYCGQTQPAGERCQACGGLFEMLSRRATHNAMGPWFVRALDRPFQPGCSYETLLRMIQRGQISKLTIIRGPTTKQFWTIARHVPGIAHLLGYCHQCDAQVDPEDHGCHSCGARFGAVVDRNYLGLPELRPLPWERQENAAPETSALGAGSHGMAEQADIDEQPGGGRLSSFATDDELLASDVSDQAWGGPEQRSLDDAPERFESQSALATQPHTESATAVADAAESPQPAERPVADAVEDNLLRIARRRALLLQAKAQKLWIALGVSIALNVILFSMMLLSPSEAVEPAADDDNPADQTTESIPRDEDTGTRDALGTTNPGNDVQHPEVEAPPVTDDEGDAELVDDASPGDAEAASPYATILADAGELIESARDENRELADRIADYEQAIKRLEDVRINAPLSIRPDDIAAQIEQAERELERLRLREFFP